MPDSTPTLPLKSAAEPALAAETPATRSPASGPGSIELTILWIFAACLFILTVAQFQTYGAYVDQFGDNGNYMLAANAIRHWNFANVQVKQFWGLSYVIALFASLGLSLRTALLLVCMASSLASVLLARKLWGPWVAAVFAFLNFTWFQVSLLGGAEPLFILSLLLSFYFVRKNRLVTGSLLAAYATLVRPLGLFALVGIGLTLLYRKDYKRAAICTAVAAVMGFLYLLPFWMYFHDPLYQFHRYKQADWHGQAAVSWPFHAITLSLIHNTQPLTNVIFTTGWIAFALAGFIAMLRPSYRDRLAARPSEYVFVFGYLLFLICYSSVDWARADFPRFVLPAVPFLIVVCERWIPRSRALLYTLWMISAFLGACSAIGIRNVMAALH